jgi:hypothetical protein
LKKKIQNGRLKKTAIFNLPNSQYFFMKVHGLILGLVGLDDAKGIDVARTASKPDRLSHINAHRIIQPY